MSSEEEVGVCWCEIILFQRTMAWAIRLTADEITAKALRYCFRTSYILPAFRIQVLHIIELILLASDRVSSTHKTNKDPGVAGIAMI